MDSPIVFVRNPADFAKSIPEMSGTYVYWFDKSTCESEDSVFMALKTILEYPESVPTNWNAVYDILGDLLWLNGNVIYVVFEDTTWSDPRVGQRLLQVIRGSLTDHLDKKTGIQLISVFPQSDFAKVQST